MSDFEKYKHMKIEGVQDELRMLVADDNKGTKKIIWHGPDKLKGDVINGASILNIIGLRGDSHTVCNLSIVDKDSDWWGTVTSTSPVVINYCPEALYETTYTKSEDFVDVPYYNTSRQELTYERVYKNSNPNVSLFKMASFVIAGDKENYTLKDVRLYSGTDPAALYSKTCSVNATKFIEVTKSGDTYSYKLPQMKTNSLPDGNVVALIKISSPKNTLFLNANLAWHFHMGYQIGGILNTYGTTSKPGSYIYPDVSLLKGKAPDYEVTHLDAMDFVPERDVYYEIYLDLSQKGLKAFYDTYLYATSTNPKPDYGNPKADWGNKGFKIRKASAEHIKNWVPDGEKVETLCNIEYNPNYIHYNFEIFDKENLSLNKKSFNLSEFKDNTIVSSSKELYVTSPEATTTLKSTYNYTPTVPLILEANKFSIDPTVFSNNYPINTVYYSGSKFIEIPKKIYGATVMNESGGLIINGIMTPADKGDSCMTAIASNNALYATCSSDQPAIIEFDPQIVYTKNTAYAKDENVLQSYKTTSGSTVNLYEANEASYFKNYSVNGTWHNTGTYVKDIWAGIEIKGNSDSSIWKNMNLMSAVGVNFGFEITGNTLIPTVGEVGQACNHLTGSSLLNLTTNSSSDKYILTYNTDKGTLPDGNVFALVRIKSSANPLFKRLYQMRASYETYGAEICNNGWHFHLGDFGLFGNGGICFPTYGKTCYSNYLPEWNGGAVKPGKVESACFVWPEDATTFEDVQNFIPEVDTWYELYIDPNCPITSKYYELKLVRCRKASEEHRRKWLANDNAVVTSGDIKVNNNKLNYEFKINAPGFTDQNIITLTGPEAISKGTQVNWHSEYYLTGIIPQDSSYYFYPTLELINSIDSAAENPEVFTESNPINVVYYSGCTFIPYNP